jgi:hypothetical protein
MTRKRHLPHTAEDGQVRCGKFYYAFCTGGAENLARAEAFKRASIQNAENKSFIMTTTDRFI